VRSKRFLLFGFVIFLGAVAGLLYGWAINPVKYVNARPESLRDDYKADYVLMVAEIYGDGGDILLAANQLALLGDQPINAYIDQAIVTGEDLQYNHQDLAQLARLSQAIREWIPNPSAGGE
jgi:hypothetical protein